MRDDITTAELKGFLFSLKFYESSAHHHQEVLDALPRLGLCLDDIARFKEQQQRSMELTLARREKSYLKDCLFEIRNILKDVEEK